MQPRGNPVGLDKLRTRLCRQFGGPPALVAKAVQPPLLEQLDSQREVGIIQLIQLIEVELSPGIEGLDESTEYDRSGVTRG